VPRFKKEDWGFKVTFTIYEKVNKVMDLTGISAVSWQFRDTKTNATKSIAGNIPVPSNGKVEFIVPQNHFDTVTVFESEIELTSGSLKENTDSFSVEVIDGAV
jgi:hypothetical protein